MCQDIPPSSVAGLGFDATCSLVALDCAGQPVTVSPSLDPQRNVILWQDHRAIKEAEEINATGHPVLKYVGGRISPEMEPPKLLWLKRHLLRECWERMGHAMDLADYLTYRATGDITRCVGLLAGRVNVMRSYLPCLRQNIVYNVYSDILWGNIP